jgi:hypothetical protein
MGQVEDYGHQVLYQRDRHQWLRIQSRPSGERRLNTDGPIVTVVTDSQYRGSLKAYYDHLDLQLLADLSSYYNSAN